MHLNKQLGVIFDMDGVLIDSSSFHRESWRLAGPEFGFEMTDAAFLKTFGMPNRAVLAHVYGRELPPEQVEAISDRKEALYRELAQHDLQALPGAVALVRALGAAGFRVALGSSTPLVNILFVLRIIGLEGAFEAIVSSGDVTIGKPDPEVFLKAAAGIGLPPAQCAVVEDAVVGVQAAKAAGMACLAVTTTHPAASLQAADRIVASLETVGPAEMRELVGQAAG